MEKIEAKMTSAFLTWLGNSGIIKKWKIKEEICSTDRKFLFTRVELLLEIDKKRLLNDYFETQNSKLEHF